MWQYFECNICGFDSDEAKKLVDKSVKRAICPLCAEDCGHSNELSFRDATPQEIEKHVKSKEV